MLEGITRSLRVAERRHLRGLPGVLSVDINYTSHRARVRWDNSRIACQPFWNPSPPLAIKPTLTTPSARKNWPSKRAQAGD